MPTPLLLRLYHEIHYKRKFSACQGGFHKVHIFFFLFHRLQRFHHVDFFHFEMHEDIHHRRESSRDQCAIEKTYRMYLSAEHYRVHLHGNDHEPVEQNAEPASEQDPAYVAKVLCCAAPVARQKIYERRRGKKASTAPRTTMRRVNRNGD